MNPGKKAMTDIATTKAGKTLMLPLYFITRSIKNLIAFVNK